MSWRVTIWNISTLWNDVLSLELVYSAKGVDQITLTDRLGGSINLDVLGSVKNTCPQIALCARNMCDRTT